LKTTFPTKDDFLQRRATDGAMFSTKDDFYNPRFGPERLFFAGYLLPLRITMPPVGARLRPANDPLMKPVW
jgi:hypothetical protein